MTNRAEHQFKIGVQLPEVEYVARWNDYEAMARIADTSGFDSIWLGDHLLYPAPGGRSRGSWECLSLLTALATVTRRVEIGPLVLATAFRNPALTAKMAETIDEISGGRLILGLGAGWNKPEFTAFGFPYDRRIDRFEEAFHIIRLALREDRVTLEGEFTQVKDLEILPRGPRPGSIPLMIGSVGERMLRITLPHVEYWNMWYQDFGNTAAGLAPYLQRVDRIALEVGRKPSDIRKTVAVLVTAPGGSGRESGDASHGNAPGITGSAATVGRALREYRELGVEHLQVVLDPITPESVRWLSGALDHAHG